MSGTDQGGWTWQSYQGSFCLNDLCTSGSHCPSGSRGLPQRSGFLVRGQFRSLRESGSTLTGISMGRARHAAGQGQSHFTRGGGNARQDHGAM